MSMRKGIAAAAAAALGVGGLAVGVGPLAFGANNSTTCNSIIPITSPQGNNCSGASGDSGSVTQIPIGTNNGGNSNVTAGSTSTATGSIIVGHGSSHDKTSVHTSNHDQGNAKANGKTGKTGSTGDGLNFNAH